MAEDYKSRPEKRSQLRNAAVAVPPYGRVTAVQRRSVLIPGCFLFLGTWLLLSATSAGHFFVADECATSTWPKVSQTTGPLMSLPAPSTSMSRRLDWARMESITRLTVSAIRCTLSRGFGQGVMPKGPRHALGPGFHILIRSQPDHQPGLDLVLLHSGELRTDRPPGACLCLALARQHPRLPVRAISIRRTGPRPRFDWRLALLSGTG